MYLPFPVHSKHKLDEGQGAYRKQRSTCDHIFVLHAITEKYLSKNGGRFDCAYVDFSCAFDYVVHNKLWNRLIHEGLHGRILLVLRSMYSKLTPCIKTSCGITNYFKCVIGTRQGCMASPLLFILFVNVLTDMFEEHQCPGIYVNELFPSLNALLYADDIILMNDTVGRLQAQLDVLSKSLKYIRGPSSYILLCVS